MEIPSGAAFSCTRTEYGSAAFKSLYTASNEQSSEVEEKNRFSQNYIRGYQSLPQYSYSAAARTTQSFAALSSSHMSMAPDNLLNSEARNVAQRIHFSLNVLNQICIGFVTIYMSWLCLSLGLVKTALHAWLVTIGYNFLMAEAIMSHYPGNVLTFSYKRNTKTTIHWVLQALGGSLGVIGGFIKLFQKGFLLQSVHGKLGFAAVLLSLFSLISGVGTLYSFRLKQYLNPLLNKTVHNFVGVITFILALLSQYYGYTTGFFIRKSTSEFQAMMMGITLLIIVLSCIGPLQALYQKAYNVFKYFK